MDIETRIAGRDESGISGKGWEIIPANLAVGPVGGLNGRDQRSSAWQTSIKRHDTYSNRRKNPVNVRCGRVGVNAGDFGDYRDPKTEYERLMSANRTGKNARKRALRSR